MAVLYKTTSLETLFSFLVPFQVLTVSNNVKLCLGSCKSNSIAVVVVFSQSK